MSDESDTSDDTNLSIQLGLGPNLAQFSLLVVVNAFVGAMVGLERTILPAIAEQEFHLAARTAVLSFIVVFGVVKAVTNYFAGRLSDAIGRKAVLVGGWFIALPIPFLLMWAPSWNWVLAANALLGVSQGLTWSTTVIMKIDLAGPERRGLAMGLNEFAGYGAVALSALATGYVAASYGLRPQPFYLGVGFAVIGLLLSVLMVRETHATLAMRRKTIRRYLKLRHFRNRKSSSKHHSSTAISRPLAKPAWSIISMTEWHGDYFPFSMPEWACLSNTSRRWPPCTRRCGALVNSLPARFPIGWDASGSSVAECGFKQSASR